MLLARALVWGGSFFFNGIAVRELPVFTVVVARVILAAVILDHQDTEGGGFRRLDCAWGGGVACGRFRRGFRHGRVRRGQGGVDCRRILDPAPPVVRRWGFGAQPRARGLILRA